MRDRKDFQKPLPTISDEMEVALDRRELLIEIRDSLRELVRLCKSQGGLMRGD